MADTIGYELLFRSSDANTANVADNRSATASVINYAFSELGIASVLGDHRGYINFDSELLISDVVELLPPERTVIELLELVEVTPQIVERCRELRERGFTFALDDIVQLGPAHAPLLPFVDIVKIDILAAPPETLPELVAKARSAGNVKLLAEKVDTRAQVDRCRELGFDMFQGYFFARPIVLQGRRNDPSRRVLLQLLEQTLDDDNDTAEIAETFKHAPDLSYKLMRLVNSVGMGMRASIESLSHALVILGRRQLQRWIQVLMFAQQGSSAFQSPLLQLACARGKLMELLVERGSNDRRLHDRAFMTGILSLIDTLLGMSMAEVIGELNLPDDVRAALLHRRGQLGRLLLIAEALERVDDEEVSSLLKDGEPCSTAELAQLQVQALCWSNRLGQTGETQPAAPRRAARAAP